MKKSLLFSSLVVLACFFGTNVSAQYYPGGFAQGKLGFWFDVNDSTSITKTSGRISAWKDKVNGTLIAAQSTNSLQPNDTLQDGRKVVNFNGTRGLSVPYNSALVPANGFNIAQILYVYPDAPVTNADFRCGTYCNNNGNTGSPYISVHYVTADAKMELASNRNSTGYYYTNYPDVRGRWTIASTLCNASNTQANYYYNGSGTLNTTVSGYINNNSGSTIGNSYNASGYYTVHWGVGEMVQLNYAGGVSANKILNVYLANKWAMRDSLYGGNNLLFTPTNPNYTNSLVGIGMEAIGDSVSATGSNNGLGLQNVSGNTGFLRSQGDYLFAADNGSGGTVALGSFFTRWARSWYIQKTDTIGIGGLVNLSFDFASYGMVSSLDTLHNNYYLLFNKTNGGFGSDSNYLVKVNSISQATGGNSQLLVQIDAINLANGYYTLVYAPKGTSTTLIPNLASFVSNVFTLRAPNKPTLVAGNTYNYIGLDSSQFSYPVLYYKIYARINGGALNVVDSTVGKPTYYAHYNLTNGNNYSYSITAVAAPGKESSLSDTAQAIPGIYAPIWLMVPQANTSNQLFMSGNISLVGLPLKYYFDNPSGGGHVRSYSTSNLYTDTGLVNGNTYSYRFKVMDSTKGSSTESGWSSTQSVQLMDSSRGGYSYNMAFLDPTTYNSPNGIGPSTITPANMDMTGMRFLRRAPAPGIHPRILINPEDSASVRWRLKNTISGQYASRWIHATTILLQLGNSGYNRNAWYAHDTLGNVYLPNVGAADCKLLYDSLAAGDIGVTNNYSNLWGNNFTKMAFNFSQEAEECWLYRNQTDSVTNTSYATRTQKLARALTVWAKKIIADTSIHGTIDMTHFGGLHNAFAYDFIYDQMTKNQQDTIRMAILKTLPDSSQEHGYYSPSYATLSNWSTFGGEIFTNIAVEGEPGYALKDSGLLRTWIKCVWNFITYGIYDKTGDTYEGIGKNRLNSALLVAMAKRGFSVLGHPGIRSFATKYLPTVIQPFGYSFIGTDILGGTGNLSPSTGGWNPGWMDIGGLKWIFPTDTSVDYTWRNLMQRQYANAPYSPTISPTYYYYIGVSENYGAGFNMHVPALLFASDYFNTPLATEAQAALGGNKFYFDSLGGQAIMRSGFDSTAAMLFFACRQDGGGHTYANKNEVLFSSKGRIWFPRVTTTGSGLVVQDSVMPTKISNSILINDVGILTDTGAYFSYGIVPGKMIYYSNSSNLLSIAGDATHAYGYQYQNFGFGGITGESPYLAPPYWNKVNTTINSYRYGKYYSFDDVSFYNKFTYPDTKVTPPYYYQRTVEAPYLNGAVKKVYRTASLVQATNPYAIIVDDVQRDNNTNNYKWTTPLAPDLSVDTTVTNLTNNNYRFDVILKEPTATGNRRLLIRVLNANGAINNTVAGTEDSSIYNATNTCTGCGLMRFKLEANAIDPQFKVMLFAYNKGDSLPVTNWSPDKTKLYVYNAGVTNTISFPMDNTGRTNINLNAADTGSYWSGNVSTDWNVAGNWASGHIPTAMDNIIIPAGVSNMPVVSNASAVANKLSIQPSATLRVDSVLQLNSDLNMLGTLTGNGTVKTYSTSVTPINNAQTWNVNIEYNNASGGQNVMKGTYNKRLSINALQAGSVCNATDTLTVYGSLNISQGNTLNMGNYLMNGNITTVSGTGTLQTQSTANPCIPVGEVWSGKIMFNATAGGQFVPAGTYQNLSCNTANLGVLLAKGAISIIDTLLINGNTTLDLDTNQLSGTINYTKGYGLLKTGNTSSNPLPANKTWSMGVAYYSIAGTQTIVNGNYSNLDLSGGATGGRILPSSGIFSISGNLIPNTGSGSLVTTNDSVTFKGTAVIAGSISLNNITIALRASLTASSGILTIGGNFSNSGTLNPNNGTIIFNGTNQSISGNNTFYNLTKTTNTACSLTLQSGAIQTINGTLTLGGLYGNLLVLNASSIGTQANINPTGARVISYVTVKDNNNTNATAINPANSYNNGNLSNWNFGPATFTWTGATDTKWNTISNWSPAILPGVSDTVLIRKTGTNNLSLEVSVTVGAITIDTFSTLSLNTQTLTTKGNMVVNGTLNGNTGNTIFAGNTAVSGVGNLNLSNITINSGFTFTTAAPINVSGNWVNNGTLVQGTQAINFNGTTNQSITRTGGESMNNLTISNTSANVTYTVPLTISNNGTVTINNGSVLDLGNNSLTVGATFTTVGTGILNTQNTTATAMPVGKTWAFTINYNNATGGQTLANGTYTSGLRASNTSGIDTLNGATTINGTLTVNTGGTLDMRGYTLITGSSFIDSGLGTIKTQGTFPNSKTWTGSVVFNSTTAYYTIQPGTYNNIDLDGGTGAARNMDIGSGSGTGTFNINGTLTWSGTGSIAFNKTTVNYSGNNQAVVSGLNYYNVGFTGTNTAQPPTVTTLNIGGVFNSGIFSGLSSGTIIFTTPSGGGVPQPGQTIPAFNFYNLTISGSRMVNITFASSGTIGVAGVFNPTATFTSSGYVTTGSNINFNGSALQNIPRLLSVGICNYGSIQVSNAAGATCASSIAIANNLTLNNGILNLNSKTDSIGGNISVVSGSFNAETGSLFLNGTSAQTIATGAFVGDSINTLTVKNSAGITFNGGINIVTSIILSNGIVFVGSYGMVIKSGASLSGASASSYISGKLTQTISNTSAITYPIGMGGNYRPVVFTYTSAPGTQTVGIQQVEAAYPTPISSVSTARFGNRYWNITQSSTGLPYTVGLNAGGVIPVGLAVMLRREGTSSATSNAVTYSVPNYTNSSSYSTINTSNDVALGETSIPLTIAGAASNSKVYDGTTNAIVTSGSLVGIVSGDVVTLTQAGNFATRNVGTGIAVTANCSIRGTNAGAYYLSAQPTLGANNITQYLLSVTAVTASKVYDGTTTSTGVPTYSLLTGDNTTTSPIQVYNNKNVGTGKILTPSGLVTNDGNGGNNYTVTYVPVSTGTITAEPLTVTAATNTKVYDGGNTAIATPTITSGTLMSGDVANFSETYTSKVVATNKTLGSSGSVNDGNSGNNYSYTFVNDTTGVVTSFTLTVTATGVDKTYDGTTNAIVILSDNRISGDNITDAYSTANFSDKNIGTGKALSVAGLNISGTDAGNYTLSSTTANAIANISALSLTLTATGVNKTYDGTTNATVTLSDNRIAGDIFTDAYTRAVFSTQNVGTGIAVNVTDISISGTNAGNYTLNNTTASTTANISAYTLIVTATSINKTYDGTANATVTLSDNRIAGDVFTDSYTSAAFGDRNVGTGKTVGVNGISISGASAGNYTLGNTIATSTANISAYTLIVSAIGNNKTYDGTTNASVTLSDNRIAGDALTDSYTTAAFSDKNVGTGKTVNVIGISISGTGAANYILSNSTATTSANIASYTLIVSAIGINKTYDGTTNANVTLNDSRIAGDVFTDSYTSAAYSDRNVGTGKTITVNGVSISGTNAGNYTLSSTSAFTTANITAYTLIVSATGVNKTYDGTTNATVTLSDNRIAGDVFIDSYTSAAFSDKNVGTGKTVSVSGISIAGTNASNYTLSNTTASATANISALPLTVSATGINKTYDGTTNATVTLSDNRITGDVFTDSYTSAAFSTKNVGTGITISVSGISISGTGTSNYTLNNTTAGTTASISAYTLTVTSTGINKTYDGTTNAAVILSDNRIAGDVFTDSYTSAAFSSKTVGTGKIVTVSGISIAGTSAGNYTLSNTTSTTSANITAYTLVVSATGINKTYDGTTNASVTLSDNKISGDNVIDAYIAASFPTSSVGNGQTVSVSGISISGSDVGNYSLGNTTASTTANINPATLSITANAQSKNYQGFLNLGTTAFTTAGLLGSDVVNNVVLTNSNTGNATSPTTDALGTYNIIPSAATGTGLSNYSISYLNGTLTVKNTVKYVWTGASDTRWNNTANWTPSAIPTAIDSVVVTKTGSNNLSLDVSTTVAYVSISSGNTVALNGQTITVGGNWVNAGTFNGNTGSNIFGWSTTLSGTGSNNFNNVTINSGATLTASSTAFNVSGNWTNNGTFTPSTGTVAFNGTTQQISPTTFYGLTISSGITTALGNIGVSSILNIASGSTLNMSSYQLSSVGSTSGTGSFQTLYTSSLPVPTGKTWAFNMAYNNTTGGQSIVAGTYSNGLTIGNTNGTDTATNNLTVNGNLVTTAGGTVDLRTYNISTSGTLNSNNTNGTLLIGGGGSSSYQVPINQTWSGTVIYYNGGNNRIVPGTYNNLNLDNGVPNFINFDNGNNPSGVFNIGGTLSTVSTLFTIRTTTFNFTGTNQVVPGILYYNLTLSGTGTTFSSGTASVANTFNPSSITVANQGTINFNGTAAQTIPAFNYNNLTISGSRSSSVSLTSSGTIGVAGTYNNTASYTSGSFVTTGSTINYNGTGAQTVVATSYNNLSISGARTSNNVTLPSSGTISIAGNFNYTPTFTTGSLVNTGSIVQFNGTINQAFTATGGITLNKLTLNNTTSGGGTISLNGGLTLASTLTLTAGKLDVGSSNFTINSGVTVSTPSASSYIVTSGTGSLIRKAITTATLFPVGTATSYAPVTITNNTASDMTVGVSPTITNAVWDSSKLVKLQWSIASSANTTASSILHQFNGTDGASNFAVGSVCENGWFNFGYNVTNVSTPISLGGNAYTLNKTGLAFTAGTTYLSVMGNQGSIQSLYVINYKKGLGKDIFASNKIDFARNNQFLVRSN